ncbi:hypothetical protein H7849_19510 [Alloacidobacterium dinghuense]|uniref:Uncharacterized protein n=1 Tax=Alloacidobacterium dinghuense TaxID=2763107 RepID=A0A7G8BFD7_9BACT|nr:hypothetical protein [Alloacidobacterium dinghuense]QNI31257.1 hypothetical protein H7849_19510 [Alloacidobacterium dinghuense]
MNRRQFAVLLPVAGLTMGCHSEQEPAATMNLIDSKKIQNAVENLGSVIGNLEEEVGNLIDGDWSKAVPKVEATASDIRIAFEHLRQALGLPTA